MEQVKGIEPSCSAWEADILPLNYTCMYFYFFTLYHSSGYFASINFVEKALGKPRGKAGVIGPTAQGLVPVVHRPFAGVLRRGVLPRQGGQQYGRGLFNGPNGLAPPVTADAGRGLKNRARLRPVLQGVGGCHLIWVVRFASSWYRPAKYKSHKSGRTSPARSSQWPKDCSFPPSPPAQAHWPDEG